MNERIKELWNKAAESTTAYPDGQNNSWETQVNFMEKFAELIVRECADISKQSQWREAKGEYYEGFNEAMIYVANKIKEHFGVEE